MQRMKYGSRCNYFRWMVQRVLGLFLLMEVRCSVRKDKQNAFATLGSMGGLVDL